jgi:hypothetical protein
VKRILCLTKVKGPFQSTQGLGRGPKLTLPKPTTLRAAPASRMWRGSFCSSTGGTEVGSGLLGMMGTGGYLDAGSCVSQGPHPGPRGRTAVHCGPLGFTPTPTSPFLLLTPMEDNPEKGSLFGKVSKS